MGPVLGDEFFQVTPLGENDLVRALVVIALLPPLASMPSRRFASDFAMLQEKVRIETAAVAAYEPGVFHDFIAHGDADDVVLDKDRGAFHVAGTPAMAKTWAEVAVAANDDGGFSYGSRERPHAAAHQGEAVFAGRLLLQRPGTVAERQRHDERGERAARHADTGGKDAGDGGTDHVITVHSSSRVNGQVLLGSRPRRGRLSYMTAPVRIGRTWRSNRGLRDPQRADFEHAVRAYDPDTGKELWNARGSTMEVTPTPAVAHGLVYCPSGRAGPTLAIRPGGSGDVTDTHIAWQTPRGSSFIPSPLVYGDYLYLTTDRGILTALDAKTGEVKYEGGRIPIPATFTASPVAFEGKILMTSEDGDTFMVKAGPKHEILGTNSVGEPVYASPAIADGRIFIRGEKHLYCIGKGAEK